MGVLNSTTTTCSDECKNATREMLDDLHGRNFAGCDCGLYLHNMLDGPNAEAAAKVDECFKRQSNMREMCGLTDAGQCQNCEAKKSMYIVSLTKF